MEVANVCAVAASSSDSGGPGAATSVYRSCCSEDVCWKCHLKRRKTERRRRRRRRKRWRVLGLWRERGGAGPTRCSWFTDHHWSLISWTHPSSPLSFTSQCCSEETWKKGFSHSLFPVCVSVSFCLRTKQILKSASHSPSPPALPHLSGSTGWYVGRWRSRAMNGGWIWMLHVQTLKKKVWYCHFGQQYPLSGVSSQLVTWQLCVTVLWYILLWPIETRHDGRRAVLVALQDLKELNRDQSQD